MRKIDLSSISTNVGMPIKSGVLSHLQLAYQEVISALFQAGLKNSYDPSRYYVLHGCGNGYAYPDFGVSSGAIFHNGEIFEVDDTIFTLSGSDVSVGTITTTFFSGADADPILFTDNIPRSVLQIRKITFGAALSGTGDVDYADLIFLSGTEYTYLSLINGFSNVLDGSSHQISQLRILKQDYYSNYITGLITGDILVSGVPNKVCIIPLEFRPFDYTLYFPVNYISSGTNYASMGRILSNGDFFIDAHTNTGTVTASKIAINTTYGEI
jgi:hypothetical protein